MPRVHLDLPDDFIYSIDIPLRTGDINYGGHLGHDSVLSLAQEARASMLLQYGYIEGNIEGPGIIISDAVLVYKSEGFYGDVLEIKIAVGDWSKSGCDFYYLLLNKQTSKEVARVKTGVVFFDYEIHKVVSVPKVFKQKISDSPRV